MKKQGDNLFRIKEVTNRSLFPRTRQTIQHAILPKAKGNAKPALSFKKSISDKGAKKTDHILVEPGLVAEMFGIRADLWNDLSQSEIDALALKLYEIIVQEVANADASELSATIQPLHNQDVKVNLVEFEFQKHRRDFNHRVQKKFCKERDIILSADNLEK